MFGRRKKKLTRKEKLQLKAAYAAGQVRPRVAKAANAAASKVGPPVSRAAGLAAEKVGPGMGRARDYAAPRVSALAATAAVAVAPRLQKARRRSGAALDALRGAETVVVVKRGRRWPVALGAMALGMVAGAVARAFAKPVTAERVQPVARPATPTVVPGEIDVVVLDDVRATSETTTTMPTRKNTF
ncbi:MAG: hypothetical protein JWM93_2425 [Frankiales bacterium]|nr:hypothetical protein [Frankiales bacterium]